MEIYKGEIEAMKYINIMGKYSLREIFLIIYRRAISILLVQSMRIFNLFREIVFRKKVMLVNSSIHPLIKNWGDDVSVQIVKCINPNLIVIPYRYSWNIFRDNDYLCIGSIISWLTTPNSIIWGSGVVYPEQKISAKPKAVLAVRGPLSRNYLLKQGIECPEIYGDPALLFPWYYNPNVTKSYKLGIIPHFRDKKLGILEKISMCKDIQIIDVQKLNKWTDFIDRINECECICSSSLHGIIVSDAYKIPNIWVEFIDGEQKRFAFFDYFQSVGKNEMESPYIIDTVFDIDSIILECKKWREPKINLERLMKVCPFKN